MHYKSHQFAGESNISFAVKIENLVREIIIQNDIPYYRIESGIEHLTNAGAEENLPVVRIITYFEDTVNKISHLLHVEFDVDIEKSVDKKRIRIETFAYKNINYTARLTTPRQLQTEYRRSGDKKFEIQICSMLQDAWGGIEKELGYDSTLVPDEAKRDFYRVGALLEMADIEFLKIRTELTKRKSDKQVTAPEPEKAAPIAPVAEKNLNTFAEYLHAVAKELVKEAQVSQPIAQPIADTAPVQEFSKVVPPVQQVVPQPEEKKIEVTPAPVVAQPVYTPPPVMQPPVAEQPVYTPPPVVQQPVYTPPPIIEQPVYTPPPVVHQPVYTAPPIAEQPVYTPPPVVQQPVYTPPPVVQPPVVHQPVYTAPPIAEQPVYTPPPVVQPPVVHQPVYTPPPVVQQPVYTPPPVVQQPVYTPPPVVQQPVPASPMQQPVAQPIAPQRAAPQGIAPKPTVIPHHEPVKHVISTGEMSVENLKELVYSINHNEVKNIVTEIPQQVAEQPKPVVTAPPPVVAEVPRPAPEVIPPVAVVPQAPVAPVVETIQPNSFNVNSNGSIEKASEMSRETIAERTIPLYSEQPKTAKAIHFDENAQMNDALLRDFVNTSKLVKEVDQKIAERAGAKINAEIDIEGDVERLRFLKVYTLKQLQDRILDNKDDIVAFAEKWIGKDNGGSFDSGISLFYLEYLLVGKRNDPAFAVDYVVKFISDNDYSARYIIPTYNSIHNTEAPNFSHLTLRA